MTLTCSQKIKDLIIRCLKAKPHERPSLGDLLSAIEEGNCSDRVKSKSVFVNNEKDILKAKFSIENDKENQGPVFNQQQPQTRSKRSATQLDLNPVKT